MNLNVSTNFFILALAVLQGSVQANSDNPCDGVTCSNKGFCVPSELYNNGYWCECDEGWVGQNCGHPQPSVVCGDADISITIDTGIVEELNLSTEADFVYFGNSDPQGTSEEHSKCSARLENGKFELKLDAPFLSCGTQVISKENDDFTFSNTVVWNSMVNSTNINRELVLLDFKCIYQDEYTVAPGDAIPTLSTLQVITNKGSFSVAMSIFEDNTFAPDKEYISSPSIGIGTYVYTQVELDSVEDPNLVVTMDQCYATQTSDPADLTTAKHFLIRDRCADNDPTVEIYSNGESHQSRFKFQMFKWRWSGDPLFLHCEVDICNKSTEECTSRDQAGCSGEGLERNRRDLEIEPTMESNMKVSNRVLTMGPLMVAVNDLLVDASSSRLADEVDVTMMYLGLSLGVVLAVLGAIVGAIIRKRRQLSSKMADAERSNRLTQLRFVREAF
ncbi:unnamed protein product [Oikopleura dioica]|uniref:ZP domain-containing protein n=2 Tax=Oikopleura dioica TaxID=34765 RepID=E4WRH3_OIKDI|nr:unnamed protein product [Oikopleura dioica]